MADYVEKWGDDIDSAVELALRDIKLTRDQVDIEVLEQPTRGFLGFHKKLAKVRVTKKAEPAPAVKEPSRPKKKADGYQKAEADRVSRSERPESAERKSGKPKKFEKHFERAEVISGEEDPKAGSGVQRENSAKKERRNKAPKEHLNLMKTKFTVTEEDEGAVAANDAPAVLFIRSIAEEMGITIGVRGDIIDDVLYVDLSGKEVGALIGKRGQTLDAVQYLASIVQNKEAGNHVRVLVNAENYREKRERTLQQLAVKVADKCVRTGRNQKLEPMNPYERKVIHSALQSHSRVTTRSEGVEPTRRVVVELKR